MTTAAISSASGGLLGFFAVAILAVWGVWLLASSSARRSALAQRGGIDLPRRRRIDELLDARLARTRRGAELGARLRSAGSERSAGQFLLMVAGLAIGVTLVFHLLFPPLLAVIAGAIAVWGCFAWLGHRLDKRKEDFIGQLPEVARLLSNGASAGLSLPAALELTVREVESPAKDELQSVIDEIQLGRSLPDALEALQRRLPSREISVLMTTLVIQQRAGGDTVDALQDLSETLDQRRQTLGEMRTLMAGAVYTSYIIPLLGLATLVLLNTISSGVLQKMTTEPLGLAALVVAGGLYVIGLTTIKRTTRLEL